MVLLGQKEVPLLVSEEIPYCFAQWLVKMETTVLEQQLKKKKENDEVNEKNK